MKGMFANDYQKKSKRMKHGKTIPISSKDRRYNTRFIRRARRGKGKPISRPISKRMKHGERNLPTNNIRIRLKRFAKNKIVDPKFLYYSLQHKQMQGEFGNLAHGSQKRQVLRKSDIAKIQLAVESGDVGTLNYSLDELADIIVDAKDYQPDDIVLARVHDTKTVGKPYFVSDDERITHSALPRLTKEQRKEREDQMGKLKAEKFQEPEPKSKTPKPRQKTNKQARERIYRAISEATDPISVQEIKEKTGATKRNIDYGLKLLKDQNRVQTIPNLHDTRKKLFTTSSRKPIITIKKE